MDACIACSVSDDRSRLRYDQAHYGKRAFREAYDRAGGLAVLAPHE